MRGDYIGSLLRHYTEKHGQLRHYAKKADLFISYIEVYIFAITLYVIFSHYVITPKKYGDVRDYAKKIGQLRITR